MNLYDGFVICPGRDASRENGILRSLIVMVLVTKIEKIRGDYAFGYVVFRNA